MGYNKYFSAFVGLILPTLMTNLGFVAGTCERKTYIAKKNAVLNLESFLVSGR